MEVYTDLIDIDDPNVEEDSTAVAQAEGQITGQELLRYARTHTITDGHGHFNEGFIKQLNRAGYYEVEDGGYEWFAEPPILISTTTWEVLNA